MFILFIPHPTAFDPFAKNVGFLWVKPLYKIGDRTKTNHIAHFDRALEYCC